MTIPPVLLAAERAGRIPFTDVRAASERARAQREALCRIVTQATRLLRSARLVIALRSAAAPHADNPFLALPDEEAIPDHPRWLPEAAHNGHAAHATPTLPPGCSAYAQLPLRLPDGPIFGYLAVFDTVRSGWASDDRDYLQVIAALIEGLIETGPGHTEATPSPHQTRQLRALAATARAITAAPDLDAVLDILTEQARAIIAAHMSVTSLTMSEHWSQVITSVSLSDRYASWRGYQELPTGKGIYARVCATNQPLRLTQAEMLAHPDWRGFGGAADRHPPLRGLLAVPLIGRDGSNVGVIQVSDKEEGEFTEEDEAILVQLAQLASGAIEQAHLYQLAQEELRERRRIEADLRASEATFRHLFHGSPQPMWVLNTETLDFLEVNDAALAQYGYSRDEFLALRATDLRPPDEVPRLREAFTTTGSPGYSGGSTWKHRTKDDRLLDVEIYFHDITFAGQPARLTIGIDVTGQREAEARLREDAAQLAALVATQQAVATADPDVPHLMRVIAEQTQHLTGADGAAIELVEGKYLVRRAVSGLLCSYPDARFDLRSSLSGLCVQLGEVLRADDTLTDPRVDRENAALTNLRSLIVAPLQYDGQTFGALKAVAAAPGAFDDRDGSTLQLLAGLAAAVLGRAAAFAAKQALITERSAALDALQESEERFRQLAEHINAAFWLADSDGQRMDIRYMSPAFEQIWGRSTADLLAHPHIFAESIHPADRGFLTTDGLNWTERGRGNEFRIVRPDGAIRWIWARDFPVRREDGTVYRIAGVFEDITERKEAEAQLAHLAYYDPLTKLPNRHFFTERLAEALARSDERGDHLALFFLDLDSFKVINDSLGHELGDRLLTIVAERLRAALRPTDLIARLGGDEYTILLERLHSLEEALTVARRAIAAVQRPMLLAGREVVVTPSIGIVFNPAARTPTEVMRDADAALYQAKAQGRGRFAIFDQAMNTRALARLDLEADLRRAIQEGQFALVYQPILALSSRRIVGVEALIRWHHPERGIVSPLDFIPIAEETGLIIPIGRWVLTEACRQLRAWQRANPAAADLTVSVNLSAREFLQPDSTETIAAVLAASGVPPECLQLEITESVLMDDASTTILTLEALNALNVRLAIDDFGTGYSSLAYLKRFPLDTLKIDRLFIDGFDTDEDDAAIVRAIVTLAQTLGLTIVAEGIEREAQVSLLVALGCAEGQGYHFARPLPPAAIDELLAAQFTASTPETDNRR